MFAKTKVFNHNDSNSTLKLRLKKRISKLFQKLIFLSNILLWTYAELSLVHEGNVELFPCVLPLGNHDGVADPAFFTRLLCD